MEADYVEVERFWSINLISFVRSWDASPQSNAPTFNWLSKFITESFAAVVLIRIDHCCPIDRIDIPVLKLIEPFSLSTLSIL